jgi:heptaprenyl diphosphate synthase
VVVNNALSLIEGDLRDLETGLLSVIRSDVSDATDICVHLAQAGGKRLRPALCFFGAYGGNNKDQVMKVAIALEIIHMATLVHDDVIDQASTRRGVPTVNTLWGPHRAVLSGDFLFARAFSLIASAGLTEVILDLSDVVSSLCEGELIQEHDLFNCNQHEEDYFNRVGKKTADFIAASCQLGALTAGFPAERVLSLRRYGYALGMAFQITDDILDVTATTQQLGKPTGNDLKQGNLTLPVIHALKASPRGDELRAIITSRDLSTERLEQCLSIVREGVSVEYSYERVNHFLKQARDFLPTDLDSEVHTALAAVAEFIGLRKY